MKITSLLACCAALVLALAPRPAHAAEEVSFDFFYNALADDGDWYNTPEYGYVWQPFVGYKTDKWRPYSDGYWAQTEDGWTWVAYENFGWATYHYGRWTRLADLGWVWVPGYEWGPGWVSWRTNDDYVGWAPLPPKKSRAVYEGKVVVNAEPVRTPSVSVAYNDVEEDYSVGYTPSVDEDYDIGPDNYCFVESHNFGAPVLSAVFLPPARNYECVRETVNVTRITYYDEGPRRVIYNSGPDFAFVSHRSDRPIQQLRIERHDDLPFVRERIRAGGSANRVQNGVFEVAAPLVARREVNFQQTRPQRVKQDLQPSRVVRGWDNFRAADSQSITRIRDQMKQQASEPVRPLKVVPMEKAPAREPNPGSVPPLPFVDRNAAPANVPPGGQPAPGGPRPALTDAERTARRDQRLRERDQRAGQPPKPGQPQAGADTQAEQERAAKQAAKQAARTQQQQQAAQQEQQAAQEKEARRAARQQQQQPQPTRQTPEERAAKQAARAQQQQQQQAPPQPQLTRQTPEERAAKQAARAQQQQQQQAPPQPQPTRQTPEERAAKQAARAQQQNQQAEQERTARQAARQQQQQQSQQAEQERAARQAARQQQQGQQAEQERAARQAVRQQPQPQQAEERAARQAARQQPQPQAATPQPKKESDDDKKKKKDGQSQ